MNNCKRSGKIDALTGFRFMAIMVIIISHLEFIGEYEKIGLFYKTYIHNATLGVDYFFMLSGFGMMLSYQKKSNSPMINGVKDCIMFAKKHVKKNLYFIFDFNGKYNSILYIYEYNCVGGLPRRIIKNCNRKYSMYISSSISYRIKSI